MPAKLQKGVSIRLEDETLKFYQDLADKDERKISDYLRRLLVRLHKEGTVSVPKEAN